MTLLSEFRSAQTTLVALGDPSRQAIISAMLEHGCESGLRVGDLTQAVNLSRPAVSHHLKILRDAQLVRMEKVGTKHFYYPSVFTQLDAMQHLLDALKEAQHA
ncbi:ArsR/SmtB family transcription factor [Lacticaseibacillus porcinae]|uniref:ArsR/SmtB family transcription factor n=1 Tax=Lacticaseibacillus porcinae TaxID=1123687 RepID=UPI000F7983B8|nr:metalloregulator ArsR/SmtB family transcription factor [Lacticaseibacillus porcinae]